MWNDAMITQSIGSMVHVPIARKAFGPIGHRQIQPASLDVRLADRFIRHPDGRELWADETKPYPLSPGECVLGCTVERVDMPDNVVARVEGKSSLARLFLTVHSAGFIDPGFKGDITLELKNDGARRIDLVPGMLIAQLSFQTLDAPAVRPYGHEALSSHYQGQTGPTAARS